MSKEEKRKKGEEIEAEEGRKGEESKGMRRGGELRGERSF